jgi:hypothetical protein
MESIRSLTYFNNAQLVSIFNQMSPIHALLFYFFKVHLILPSHLLLGIQTGLFLSGVPTQTPCEFIFDTRMLRAHPYHPPLDHPSNIRCGVQIMEFPIIQFSSSYSIPAVTKYSQLPIIENLQSTYFPSSV